MVWLDVTANQIREIRCVVGRSRIQSGGSIRIAIMMLPGAASSIQACEAKTKNHRIPLAFPPVRVRRKVLLKKSIIINNGAH